MAHHSMFRGSHEFNQMRGITLTGQIEKSSQDDSELGNIHVRPTITALGLVLSTYKTTKSPRHATLIAQTPSFR